MALKGSKNAKITGAAGKRNITAIFAVTFRKMFTGSVNIWWKNGAESTKI